MKNTDKLKTKIVAVGKRLYDKGFAPGTSGNISVKYENNVLITPSGINLGEMTIDDIVIIDSNGNIIEGCNESSSEKTMHLEIYNMRHDITSIIHAHSPKATAFAVAGISLNNPVLAEGIITLGEIAIAEYAMPSSDKLAHTVASYFKNHEVVLMANHGVAVGGKNLNDTYYKLETLELYAEVSIWTKLLGNANNLSKENIEELIELKKKLLK